GVPAQVHGWQVGGADATDLAHRDFDSRFLGSHRKALSRGRARPVLHRVGIRGGELDVRLQWRQLFRKLADDLLQGALLDLEIALRSDLLGSREIEARLRLVSIGDGCSTNLEIAFRLGELLCYRDLLALNERETVLRCEHVEIGLGYAHD